MKIIELLTEKIKTSKIGNIPVKHLPLGRNFSKKALHQDFVGEGQEAMVFNKRNDPNTVIKVSLIAEDTPEKNGTVQYISAAMDHQNNPFVPRISKAKIYTIPGQYDVLYIEMEKLHELRANKLKHNAEPIFKSLGLTNELFQKSFKLKQIFDGATDPITELMHWMFADKAIMKEIIDISPNPQFKEALHIVQSTAGNIDMHAGNFMFRLTSVGPQLVITDPVT